MNKSEAWAITIALWLFILMLSPRAIWRLAFVGLVIWVFAR